MITFKCKMCGGNLNFEKGASVTECPYCGTMQTLPKLGDDKRTNMYDRANHFRRQNEYDKATALYEQILAEDRSDAEAYWSLVLCRYGIEYVEDPATHKRVPTVNRVQYDSILADEDYKAALHYSDEDQRKVYETEANTIAEIQKGILDISRQEQPFDVFICYKETDDSGKRTRDSALAQEIYYQLTNEGYKVFFSRITLEDKLGQQYEPYIFAALNSAKVMLVIGTKPEYFKAVWVRNEWSRFLALSKKDRSRLIIPCYRDMDPYDLPDELSLFQSQDMSKIGFIQDLVRGIKKVLPKGASAQQSKTASQPVIDNAASASESENSVLDQLAKLQRLYEKGVIDEVVYQQQKAVLVNTLAQTQEVEEEPLPTVQAVDELNLHIRRDKQRASGEAKTYLYLDGNKDTDIDSQTTMTVSIGIHRISFQRAALKSNAVEINVQPRKKYTVNLAVSMLKLVATVTEEDVPIATTTKGSTVRRQPVTVQKQDSDSHVIDLINKKMNEELADYDAQIKKVEQEIEITKQEYAKKKKSVQRKTQADYDKSIAQLNEKLGALKARYDATKARYLLIRDTPAERKKWIDTFMGKENRYRKAQTLMENGDYLQARETFILLDGFLDSKVKAEECDKELRGQKYKKAILLQKQKKWEEAYTLFCEAGAYQDAATRAEQCKKKLKGNIIPSINQSPLNSSDAMAGSAVINTEKAPKVEKKKSGCLVRGFKLLAIAVAVFVAIIAILGAMGYLQGDTGKKEREAITLIHAGKYDDAIEIYKSIGKNDGASYVLGLKLQSQGDFDDAIAAFEKAGAFNGASEELAHIESYRQAEALLENGDRDGAIQAFAAAELCYDAVERKGKLCYEKAEELLSAGDVEGAIGAFSDAGAYGDARDRIKQIYDAEGDAALDEGDYEAAVSAYEKAENKEKLDLARVELAKNMLETGDHENAYNVLITMPDVEEATALLENTPELISIRKSAFQSVGNTVTFGSIEWIVLQVDGGKSLLISKDTLDGPPFNTDRSNVTWENCTIRTWLNERFFNDTFSDSEKQAIVTTKVDNSAKQGNSEYSTVKGNTTKDKLFFLSYKEAWSYFFDDDSRSVGLSSWWLRSPGKSEGQVAVVSGLGTVSSSYVNYSLNEIRPAMWIDTSKL